MLTLRGIDPGSLMFKVTRAESVRRNDEAIRFALIHMISETGWDSVTVSGVAKRANVTVGAVYARAENIAELANDAWINFLFAEISEVVKTNCAAVRSGESKEILRASRIAEEKISVLKTAIELLVAAQFDEELNEVIGSDFANLINQEFALEGNSLEERHQTAAYFLVNSFLFGRLLALSNGESIPPLSLEEAHILAGFFSAVPCESDPLDLPELKFAKPSEGVDPTKRSIFEVFSRWGYRKTTLARMARATRSSPGAVIAGFDSKEQIIGDAARSSSFSTVEVWAPFERLQTAFGAPAVRAQFLFKYLDPQNRSCWRSNLELARLAPNHIEMTDFGIPADALQRTHIAVMFFALYGQDFSTLPFEGCFNVGYTT